MAGMGGPPPAFQAGVNSMGLPLRPGLAPCGFFLQKGQCKFGNACRFDHPEVRPGVPDITADGTQFNSKGMAVRNNKEICAFYARSGRCDFGATCKFNHPETVDPAVAAAYRASAGKGPTTPPPGTQHAAALAGPGMGPPPGMQGAAALPARGDVGSHGYPLRPGAETCVVYSQIGTCEDGMQCPFDHPEALLQQGNSSAAAPASAPAAAPARKKRSGWDAGPEPGQQNGWDAAPPKPAAASQPQQQNLHGPSFNVSALANRAVAGLALRNPWANKATPLASKQMSQQASMGNPEKGRSKGPCKFFAAGSCRKNERCEFSHDVEALQAAPFSTMSTEQMGVPAVIANMDAPLQAGFSQAQAGIMSAPAFSAPVMQEIRQRNVQHAQVSGPEALTGNLDPGTFSRKVAQNVMSLGERAKLAAVRRTISLSDPKIATQQTQQQNAMDQEMDSQISPHVLQLSQGQVQHGTVQPMSQQQMAQAEQVAAQQDHQGAEMRNKLELMKAELKALEDSQKAAEEAAAAQAKKHEEEEAARQKAAEESILLGELNALMLCLGYEQLTPEQLAALDAEQRTSFATYLGEQVQQLQLAQQVLEQQQQIAAQQTLLTQQIQSGVGIQQSMNLAVGDATAFNPVAKTTVAANLTLFKSALKDRLAARKCLAPGVVATAQGSTGKETFRIAVQQAPKVNAMELARTALANRKMAAASSGLSGPLPPGMRLNSAGYPLRENSPDCPGYMVKGICELQRDCPLNHPEEVHQAVVQLTLNSQGFPLYEGREECYLYAETGKCAQGIQCPFHHPEELGMPSAGALMGMARAKSTGAPPGNGPRVVPVANAPLHMADADDEVTRLLSQVNNVAATLQHSSDSLMAPPMMMLPSMTPPLMTPPFMVPPAFGGRARSRSRGKVIAPPKW